MKIKYLLILDIQLVFAHTKTTNVYININITVHIVQLALAYT